MKTRRILVTFTTLLLVAGGCASPDLSKSRRFDCLALVGTPQFEAQVEQALTLLKAKSPAGYAAVTNYVGVIQEFKHSGMEASHQPPVFQLNDRSAFYSVTWCAGVIAHDSIHSKLYHDYQSRHGGRVPDGVWTGHEAERICLGHQLRVLKEIGAPENETEYFKTLTPDYADVPYRHRNW